MAASPTLETGDIEDALEEALDMLGEEANASESPGTTAFSDEPVPLPDSAFIR